MFKNNTLYGGFFVDTGGSMSLYDNCFQYNTLASDLVAFFDRGAQSYDFGGFSTVYKNSFSNDASQCPPHIRHLCNSCDGVNVVEIPANSTNLLLLDEPTDVQVTGQRCFPFVVNNWVCQVA